jgi:hypothetical protein
MTFLINIDMLKKNFDESIDSIEIVTDFLQ